ncbi:MFS general substrate transporter [Phanerochaete sordida]|uniref:MFS general substrate transporter n=1 Tax=Phanerochaete sordida TaxID=48140 RepID=A0A9P3GHU3_9APHY|nr:MFS general substrate transporter [Phanerochaete sordida]
MADREFEEIEVNEWLLADEEGSADEKSEKGLRPQQVTPLPKLQIAVLLWFQLGEPMTSQCIYPFINQLVSELDITGGDPKKVGYYAGLVESLFFAAEAMFVLHWSRISDHIGRKPVLLIGMAGLCISMICFGLSKTYIALVLSRCLVGALNGNLGVIKSMMAELTDHTNMAQGFAWIPVVWSVGSTVGPLIGGVLSKPHDRWPTVFASPFWVNYAYFLPCLVIATFAAFTFVLTATVLKETVQKPRSHKGTAEPEDDPETRDAPLPLRALLVRPVLLSVANYGVLALVDIMYRAVQPLFFSTPVAAGGLGLTPARIGGMLAAVGLASGAFQVLFFARLVRRVGQRRLFLLGMAMYSVVFLIFPCISLAARADKTALVWLLVVTQLALSVACDMTYGCVYMYVTSSAPNRRSLGATNGLAQLAASILRACGPAIATSLFAATMSNHWLSGYAVYVILISLSASSLLVGRLLPVELWNQ